MDVKPRFKISEVGEIPQEWSAETLGRLVDRLSNGFVYTKSAVSDFPVTRIETISDGVINFERVGYAKGDANIEKFRLQVGDILFSHINSLDHIGKVALYDGLVPLYHGMNLLLLRRGPRINAKYLYYWLSSRPGRRTSTLLARQAVSQASINTTDLRAVSVPLPPTRAEQDSIAEALSDADAYIESLERLLVKKHAIKQGVIQEIVTGKRRLSGFNMEWARMPLSQVGKCYRGVTYNPFRDLFARDTPSSVRLLRSSNVRQSAILFHDLQYVDKARVSPDQYLRTKDVLICMANGSRELVGKSGLFQEDDGCKYTFGAFMGCFRTISQIADPDFVFYLFQTERYRSDVAMLLAGSSINNLTPTAIESHRVLLPSDREEQKAIADILADMDFDLLELGAKLSKARDVKEGMMQQLLTGKIRLV